MARAYDVMCAGHLCLDIIPRFPDTGARQIAEIMRPGKLVNIEEATLSTGGPVSNTGMNLQVLGLEVCFCARTGRDVFGELTIDLLRGEGNADGVHVVDGVPSSYTIAIAPPHIDRIFLHNPGTNNVFSPDDLDPELVAQCRHFHFGYPPLMRGMYENDGAGLDAVFRIAKAAGATTSCDMTLPDPASISGRTNWRRILEKILPNMDLYLPSVEETFFMLEPEAFLRMKEKHDNADLIDFLTPEDYARLADTCLSMGAKAVSLKTGHRGFYLKTGEAAHFAALGAVGPGHPANWSSRELWAPAFRPPVFGSATGSGDSAIAGLLAAFLRGLRIETALKYATCLGLQNVQVLDAVSGIQSWEETTHLLQEDLPLLDAHIAAQGWHWSTEHGLWAGPADPLSQGS